MPDLPAYVRAWLAVDPAHPAPTAETFRHEAEMWEIEAVYQLALGNEAGYRLAQFRKGAMLNAAQIMEAELEAGIIARAKDDGNGRLVETGIHIAYIPAKEEAEHA